MAQGGKVASKWAAFGIGLAWLTAIAAVIFDVFFGADLLKYGPKVTFGSNDNIYYSGSAAKEDARALGEALKTASYFTDRGATVLLSKGAPNGTVISFVVKTGTWSQPEMVAAFEEIGRQVAASVGGFPVHVRLLNSEKQPQRENDSRSNHRLGQRRGLLFGLGVGGASQGARRIPARRRVLRRTRDYGIDRKGGRRHVPLVRCPGGFLGEPN